MRFRVAAVQMTSTEEVDRNLDRAEGLVRRAAGAGAGLVALPENFAYLRSEGSEIRFRTDLDGELVGRFGELAAEFGCHLLLGSVPERIPGSRRIHNTSVLLGPGGNVLATYRKMHLFDVSIPGKVDFRESRTVVAGDRVVVADTALGRLGLSICYDLRFPELYRRLALAGAEVLLVPSAFTAFTGRSHWLPLLRARAIENLCWVVAPAQVGRHSETRTSWGETAVIDPWGEVVAKLDRKQGWVEAEIDLDAARETRRGLPCLDHVRPELTGVPRRPGSAAKRRPRAAKRGPGAARRR
jgi:predicted amidohydrolase